MDLASTALPIGLGVVMLGLGLDLTIADFRRVATAPRAVIVALVAQLIILPLVALGLAHLFGLSPILSVGLLLLAACPGGPAANLYSHLFGGDVALNVSLTALNSVLSILYLPLVYNLAAWHFLTDDTSLGLQFSKAVEVFAIVLIPVALGMLVRARWSGLAARLDRPIRIASLALLVVLIIGAIVQNREVLAGSFGELAGVAGLFGLVNLVFAYVFARAMRLTEPESVACSFEIGLHNAVMAIVIARTVIGSEELALPGAVYTVLQMPMALVLGTLYAQVRRARRNRPISTPTAPTPA